MNGARDGAGRLAEGRQGLRVQRAPLHGERRGSHHGRPPPRIPAIVAAAGRHAETPVITVETRVVDAEMRDVAPGEQGEILKRQLRDTWADVSFD